MLGQHLQKQAYNQGHLSVEFKEGDLILLNPHSLFLLRPEKGHGRELLMKCSSPFEITQKVSPVLST